MAGFLKGGPRPPSRMSGPPKGARSFLDRSSSSMPMPMMHPPMHDDQPAGEETKIIHLPSGEYEVHHADGDVTKHPNADHMTAHLGAKLNGDPGDDMDGDETYEEAPEHQQ